MGMDTSLKKKKRVLIVDDSAVVRQSLTEIINSDPTLEVMGVANDPFIAAKKMSKEIPDVITLDVEMPRMDGMHLVKRLRDTEAYSQTPIVMFSSLMSEDNRAKALSLGANDTITKPEIGRMVNMMDKHVFSFA